MLNTKHVRKCDLIARKLGRIASGNYFLGFLGVSKCVIRVEVFFLSLSFGREDSSLAVGISPL